MSELEGVGEFLCPYCSSGNTISIDQTAGKHQNYVTDCETCCKPITVDINIDDEGRVDIAVKGEND